MPGLEMSIATANRRDVLVATVAAALGGSVVAGIFTVWSLWRTHRSPLEQAGSLPGNARCHELSQGRFFLSWIIGRFRRLSGKSVLFGKCLTSDMERVESPSRSQVESNQALGSEVKSAITHASNNRSKLDHFNPSKRQGYLSWDDYFMAIAFLSAQRSKDPNRQVGACVVSQDQIILGIGYNGFPRGCSDDKLPWAKMSEDGDPLKTKYPYVCHAEVNAILNRNHASAAGQRLFVTMFPCNECAKVIIQARIAEVVYFTEKGSFTASRRLLAMAGVKVWQYKPGTQALLLEYR